MILRKLVLLFYLYISFSHVFSQGQQGQSNEMVLCWDTSKSMQARDLEKDFSVLERAFQKTSDVEVQLLLFGINIHEKRYSIKGGNWLELRNELSDIVYDGATIFSPLNTIVGNRPVLLFSDGNQLFKDDFLTLGKGSIIVNSCVQRNEEFFKANCIGQ